MLKMGLTEEERKKWIKENSIVEQRKLGTTEEEDTQLEE